MVGMPWGDGWVGKGGGMEGRGKRREGKEEKVSDVSVCVGGWIGCLSK